jgi:hypothetical protein
MIARHDPFVAAYDLRIDGVGVMLRPQPEGGALVSRRLAELDENPQLDNIRPRGYVVELRFTVIAQDHVQRRDGSRDTLTSGRQIKRLVERAAARGGPTPTELAFATGEEYAGSVRTYTAQQTRFWPAPAWDLAVVFHQPQPVR